MTEEEVRLKIYNNRKGIEEAKVELEKAIKNEDDEKVNSIEDKLLDYWKELKWLTEQLENVKY